MNCSIKFLSSNINLGDHDVPAHSHNCYELVYYVTGQGTTTFNKDTETYKSNTFCIVTPETLHSEFSEFETNTKFLGFTVEDTDIKPISNLYFDKSKKVLGLLESIENEYEEKKLHYKLKIKLLIMEILIEISRMENKNDTEASNEFANIINYIDDNITKEIDLKKLAKDYHMSYDRFRHIFKEIVGASPNRYITMGRLKKSITLLKSTELTITEIAMESGFTDAARYSVVFKRTFGSTPQAYRSSFAKSSNDEEQIQSV